MIYQLISIGVCQADLDSSSPGCHRLRMVHDNLRYDVVPPELPSPWALKKVFGVGGLSRVGFAASRDLLLVESSSGLGLYDTVVGIKIARNYDLKHTFEQQISLTASGFDLLDGELIAMAGIWGGALRRMTRDGFYLSAQAPNWPDERIILDSPSVPKQEGRVRTLVVQDQVTELRAYGFSETGNSFIVATSSELWIFSR